MTDWSSSSAGQYGEAVLPIALQKEDWMKSAACRGMDPDIFFPQKEDLSRELRRDTYYQEARQVCSTCLVRAPCLAYARRIYTRLGMWGGLTPTERRSPSNTFEKLYARCTKCESRRLYRRADNNCPCKKGKL